MKAPGIVAFAIVVGGLCYFIGHHDGKDAAAESVRAEQRKTVLHQGVEWMVRKRLADEASRKSAPQRDSTPRISAKAGADSLRPRIAALEDSLRGTLSVTDSLLVYRELTFNLHRENEKLRAALAAAEKEIRAWKEEAVRYHVAADSALPIMEGLAQALEAETRAHTCRIAFVPCPSRGASLLVGVALGLTAAVALH